MQFDVGDRVTMTAVFTDPITGQASPLPAGAVTCLIRDPSGAQSSLAVVQTQNVAKSQISITAFGWWRYRFVAVGAVEAAEENRFYVREPWSSADS